MYVLFILQLVMSAMYQFGSQKSILVTQSICLVSTQNIAYLVCRELHHYPAHVYKVTLTCSKLMLFKLSGRQHKVMT